MPIYTFQCKTCDNRFDKLQKFKDAPPPCPAKPEVAEDAEPDTEAVACGGESKRVFASGGAFHLKGGGWANEGYR